MDLQKLGIKLYLDPATVPSDASVFIPVFQAWLQKGALDGLWIDAVDYSHVPDGPGAVLVGHEANLSFERGGEGPGILFQRKTPMDGGFADRLRLVLRGALQAASLLEKEGAFKPGLQFLPGRLAFVVNDRLRAPNTEETFGGFRPILEGFLDPILGGKKARLRRGSDPKLPFQVDADWPGGGALSGLKLG